MNQGKLVFSQLMALLPLSTFRSCVATHRGDHKVQDFTCMDQFLTMAFAQLTYRESLRDIEVNLRAHVSHGPAIQDRFAQQLGQCERNQTMANLRRLCETFDYHGTTVVRQRPVGNRPGRHGLRL